MKCLTVIACLIAFATAQNLRGGAPGDDYKSSNGDSQNGNLPQYSETTMEPPKGKMKVLVGNGSDYEPVYTAEQQKRLGVDKYGNVADDPYSAMNLMNPGNSQQNNNKGGQKGNSQQQKGNSETTMEPPKGKMKVLVGNGSEYEPVYTAEQQKRLGVDKYGNVGDVMNPGKKPQQKGNSQQNNNKGGQKGNSQHQKGNSQQQKWGQKGNSQQNNNKRGQKGNSQQNNNKFGQKGKWTQQFYNKEHKCTVTKIPANLQTQYKTEFNALDVDNNGYLDSSEFKDEGTKISDAFSNFRKGKKPSWYKGNKNGNNNQNGGKNNQNGGKNNQSGGKNNQNGGRGGNQNGGKGGFGRGNQNGGQNNQNGGGRGGFGRGGNQNGGQQNNQNGGQQNNQNGGQQNNQNGGRGRGERGQRRNGGGRQLADKTGDNFWKYLQQKGFVPKKPNQSMKDKLDSARAAQIFKRFDQDHNNKVSLCEYENAMYRTEMLEKRMGNKNDGMVVVHG